MGTDISNHPLLPSDDDLTFWQQCVKNAIIGVHSRWAPYKLDGGGGATRTVYWKGPNDSKRQRILTAKNPVHTYCNGVTNEIFFDAWTAWMEGYEDQSFGIKEAKELRAFFGVWDVDHPGSAQGLLWLAEQPPCDEYLSVEDWTEDPYNIPFGAFVQIQFGRKYDDGHSVVSLGTSTYKKKQVLLCYSSNTYYDQNWKYSKGQQPGPGFDYYYIDKVRDGFKRIFHAAEIEDDE
jgi:hypothetical protein